MARPPVVTLVAAAGALLLAVGLLSQNTTGWPGIAAGTAFWLGVAGLVVATVLLVRGGLPQGAWRRAGFALVAAGLVTTAGALVWAWTAPDEPCHDTGSCIHPAAERFARISDAAAVVLILGAATLLVDAIVGVRPRRLPAA